MNYFNPKNTAERYAIGRPYFHPNTIGRIKNFLKIEKKLHKVLDVACGTGLSTKALLAIAENIYGIDSSTEMLNLAYQNDKIKYSVSFAENTSFAENYFDLITVSSGVHWFRIDEFLKEVYRILKPNNFLILYENYFISEMQEVEDFKNWFPEVYLNKFPSPPRNNAYNWENENINPKGFTFIKEEKFKNTIEFSQSELILYFTTQSNITSAIENGNATYEEAENWLNKEMNPFFNNKKRKINYGNWIKYIQKN